MIWPLNKFVDWAKRQGVKDAQTTAKTLEAIHQDIAIKNA